MNELTEAQRKLGLQYPESVFYRAALEAGFRGSAESRARELNAVWTRTEVLKNLPKWVRDFIEDVNKGGIQSRR